MQGQCSEAASLGLQRRREECRLWDIPGGPRELGGAICPTSGPEVLPKQPLVLPVQPTTTSGGAPMLAPSPLIPTDGPAWAWVGTQGWFPPGPAL